MKVYINSIKFNRSLVDGPGVRTVVFFQGCDLHCKGCQNSCSWDIKKGLEVDTEELAEMLKKEVINKKITFSGGEPLLQAEALFDIVTRLKGFDIAVYTGHELEDVPKKILDNIKYIKTGPFVESLRTATTPYVGSTNQEFRRLR